VGATCQRGKKERGRETQVQWAGARKKATRGKLGRNREKGPCAHGGEKKTGEEREGRGWLGRWGKEGEREEGDRGPGCRGEKREEGGGQLGWAQRRREGEGKRKQTNQKTFEFKTEIWIQKRDNQNINARAWDAQTYDFPIFIFILKENCLSKKSYDSFNLSFYLIFLYFVKFRVLQAMTSALELE
jgi:hypothetical protein